MNRDQDTLGSLLPAQHTALLAHVLDAGLAAFDLDDDLRRNRRVPFWERQCLSSAECGMESENRNGEAGGGQQRLEEKSKKTLKSFEVPSKNHRSTIEDPS